MSLPLTAPVSCGAPESLACPSYPEALAERRGPDLQTELLDRKQ